MSTEFALGLLTLAGIVFNAILAVYLFERKRPLEIKATNAEAINDTASAQKMLSEANATMLITHNQTFEALTKANHKIHDLESKNIERDLEYKRRLSETEFQLSEYKRTSEAALAEERKRREAAEVERDQYKKELDTLKHDIQQEREVHRRQMASLQETVDQLRREVSKINPIIQTTVVQETRAS